MMRVALAVFAFVAVVSALPQSPPPCICTMEYAPVCGYDGVTYGNQCAMDCAGVELSHSGECQKLCMCPKNYMPVCGQDGKTYSNQCEMNCAGVAFFQDGACKAVASSPIQKRADVCICTMEYAPVCGSDGVTYGNKCNLNCVTGVTLNHAGAC